MNTPFPTVWQKGLLLLGEENSVETIPMCLEADFGFTYESLLLSLKTTGPEPTGPRRNRSNSFHVQYCIFFKGFKMSGRVWPSREPKGTVDNAFGDLGLRVTNLSSTIESPGAAPKSPCCGLCLSPVQAELLSWHENISKLSEGLGLQAGWETPVLAECPKEFGADATPTEGSVKSFWKRYWEGAQAATQGTRGHRWSIFLYEPNGRLLVSFIPFEIEWYQHLKATVCVNTIARIDS